MPMLYYVVYSTKIRIYQQWLQRNTMEALVLVRGIKRVKVEFCEALDLDILILMFLKCHADTLVQFRIQICP
jgi:hypothetical protein